MIIKTTFEKMKSVLASCCELVTDIGENNLLFTGAKASYLGGGWWRLHGYSWNNHDIFKVIEKLEG